MDVLILSYATPKSYIMSTPSVRELLMCNCPRSPSSYNTPSFYSVPPMFWNNHSINLDPKVVERFFNVLPPFLI